MVVAETYYREDAEGRKPWFNPADVTVDRDDKGRIVSGTLQADGQPVDPGRHGEDVQVEEQRRRSTGPDRPLWCGHGAPLHDVYLAPDQSLEWSDDGVEGAARFLKRVWNLAQGAAEAPEVGLPSDLDEAQQTARREVHAALQKALYDYERHQFNTVVSACMTMVNTLMRLDETPQSRAVLREGLGIVLRLLAPIAPHVTHHLWRELAMGEDILAGGWPEADEDALRRDEIEYVVQVNGKVRGKVEVPAGAGREVVEAAALANENVRRFIGDGAVRKVVVVPNKLINVVAG